MRRVAGWLWSKGVVSTFLAGFFVVLPIAITIGIMGWVGAKLADMVGPSSSVGQALRSVGMRLATDDTLATIVGWVLALAAIWLLGLVVKASARNSVQMGLARLVERVPLIGSIYKPVAQVVEMMSGDGQADMKGMQVVYCQFGRERGGGFLALLTGSEVYRFADQDCYVIYVPTSPVPMSGGIVFVPVDAVQTVDMQVDDLMQIYFSLGVMSAKVVPTSYVPGRES